MADSPTLTDAERTKLERRRDRLMELMNADGTSGAGSELDADDREDLAKEWKRIDDLLNRR